MSTGLRALWPDSSARRLIWQLSKRDIVERFRRHTLGVLWMLIGPMAMLAVLMLVMQDIMGMRWPNRLGVVPESGAAFGARIYIGLVLFQCLADVVSAAPRLMASNRNLVKRVVFPLQVLSWVQVSLACIGLCWAVVVLALLGLMSGAYTVGWHWLLVLLVWVPFLAVLLALSQFLAAVGAYIPDVQTALPPMISALMFLSPVFYPFSMVPVAHQGLMALNPLVLPIELSRALLLEGVRPNMADMSAYAGTAVLAVLAAAWWFRRLQRGFADVI